MNEIDKKRQLLKSNNLITARHNLTLIQSKFIALMASKIKPDHQVLTFKTKEVLKALGLGVKNHQRLYENIETIMSKIIKIKTDKSFSMFSMLSDFTHEFKEDTIKIEFSQKLNPFLLALKEKFTILDLPKILNAKSSYTIKFYEIIQMKVQQYEKYKNKDIINFTYEYLELRKLFLIPDEKYKTFDNFNRRILKVAQAELNNNYRYSFKYKLIKSNRKVVKIEFEIIELIVKEKSKKYQIFYDLFRSEVKKAVAMHRINAQEVEAFQDLMEEFYEDEKKLFKAHTEERKLLDDCYVENFSFWCRNLFKDNKLIHEKIQNLRQ